MGLVHCKGEDKVLLLLRWRCTLGVRHAELGLRILGLWIVKVQSSELLSLLLPSSPQLEKSSCWLIPSNTIAMLWAWVLAKVSFKMLSPAFDYL